ncbi:hypothetical protein [Limoniibacter endophyticus]|uniref:Uncharacterized protein n=1 Tax=Limoniibacter endophyticus TaxID=1565040 RepID=A0A8J3DG31_9HYPH|nr:hypothetical protein [Limoniibacter endophyticus]GHC63131.1 hypothetical protein GCM10010136_04700 [Limoniibacter endophyticus]
MSEVNAFEIDTHAGGDPVSATASPSSRVTSDDAITYASYDKAGWKWPQNLAIVHTPVSMQIEWQPHVERWTITQLKNIWDNGGSVLSAYAGPSAATPCLPLSSLHMIEISVAGSLVAAPRRPRPHHY